MSLEIDTLVGRKVLSAKINSDNDLVVLDTDKGTLYLSWEGDCCAHCFLANVSGSENLVGATILEATNAEWQDIKRDDENYDVIESMGTKLKTTKGYVDFESRVEHNGYYGGRICINDNHTLEPYSSTGYYSDPMPKVVNLKDF